MLYKMHLLVPSSPRIPSAGLIAAVAAQSVPSSARAVSARTTTSIVESLWVSTSCACLFTFVAVWCAASDTDYSSVASKEPPSADDPKGGDDFARMSDSRSLEESRPLPLPDAPTAPPFIGRSSSASRQKPFSSGANNAGPLARGSG